MKLKPEKNSGLNRIRTHDLCDTGAVLRYRYWCSCRGHGFESCSGLNFFHALISQLLKLCVCLRLSTINSYLSLQLKCTIFHIFIYNAFIVITCQFANLPTFDSHQSFCLQRTHTHGQGWQSFCRML